MPDDTLSAEAIGSAPKAPPTHLDYEAAESTFYSDLAAHLQIENAELRTALDKAGAQLTAEQVKVQMMRPWANKVFLFVCAYCLCLGAIIVTHGFGWCGFELSDPVLSILAGSTAVSVIGLIGIVLTGLFGAAKQG